MPQLSRFILLFLPLLVAAKCDDEGNPIVEPDEFTVLVELKNLLDPEPIHIFVASRNESFPCCQLSVNGTRTVNLTLRPVSSYVFLAGRGGVILKETTCRTLVDADAGDTYEVTWFQDSGEDFLWCIGTGWE